MSEIESLRARTAGVVHDRDVARHDRDVARHDRDVARRERDLLRHDREVLEARLSDARERLAVAEAERERIAFELASVYAGGWWRLRRQVRPLLRLASATRRT
jgi:hypothetical protein